MSQQQPQRPQEEAIKYGNVFPVSGELASKTVAPRDAAMMQAAESTVFGKTQRGGPAAAMQSAATINERAGFVSHGDVSDAVLEQGVSVTEKDLPGVRVFTESIGGQVVGQCVQDKPIQQDNKGGLVTQGSQGGGRSAKMTIEEALTKGRQGGGSSAKITIGEALEAVAATTGDKPVELSDAAAIQAAEVRATGSNVITAGGLTSSAQSAASMNSHIYSDENKIKLGEVLTNATLKLPVDKKATHEDAKGVESAEQRNNPNVATHPAGVAASLAAAARLNEGSTP